MSSKKLTYWEQRKNLNYYRQVLNFAQQYVPEGGRVLDVGGRDCRYITWFDWFSYREVIDLIKPPKLPGVVSVKADFLDYRVETPFELTLCLQVLEHLSEPGPFCRKVIASGLWSIVSVPYKWPRGLCHYHLQDPVDESKLMEWAGQRPMTSAIVKDNRLRRLIAIYSN